MRYATVTLGCKVNQYETQLMREALGPEARPAGRGERADVVIVNTCSVTASADRQSRQALRRARREHPRSRILAAGCYARREDTDPVKDGLADARVAAPSRRAFLSALGIGGEEKEVPWRISRFDGHTRAFVKVQDGCDRRCSFCIVPLIRGGSRSRARREITGEVKALFGSGVPEVVLCGVRLNAYRDPAGKGALSELLFHLLADGEGGRIRLSSLHPGRLDRRLLEAIATHPRVCRHVHLPAQSGSDRILKAMRRGYGAEEVRGLAEEMRKADPNMGLTADILVGFPGESEYDFRLTRGLIEEVAFDRVHLFPFSPRPGTPAASLAPLPAATVRRRMKDLEDAAARVGEERRRRMIGRDVVAVIEGAGRGGLNRGLTGAYQPIWFGGKGFPAGSLARLRVTGLGPVGLRGLALGPCVRGESAGA